MWVPPQGRARVLSRHWPWALQGVVWGPSERGTVVQGTMESSWLMRTWGHLSCRPRPARLCPRSWSMLVLGTASPRATQGQAPTVPGLVASRHWPQREDWGPPLTDGLTMGPRLHAEPPLVPRPLTTLCALTCCVEGVEGTHSCPRGPSGDLGGPALQREGQKWPPSLGPGPRSAGGLGFCRLQRAWRTSAAPRRDPERGALQPLPLPTRGGGSPVTGAPGDPGGPRGGALVPVWLSAGGSRPHPPPSSPAIPPSHAQAQRHRTV